MPQNALGTGKVTPFRARGKRKGRFPPLLLRMNSDAAGR